MTALTDWTPTTGQSPNVRVGIVLPSDGASRLRLLVPDAAYDLAGDVGSARSMRSCRLGFEVVGEGVQAELDGQRLGVRRWWAIAPGTPDRGGDGPAVAVHGVTAGRGFHWESRTEQRLPGELAVGCIDGNLLLTCRLWLEDYLAGVITSEMSGDCPAAFMEAQCVVARSWTLAAAERKHADLGIDLCNDDCCQRYQGVGGVTEAARWAVERTRGLVLIGGDGRVVDANYSKCCGGIVEEPEHVWGRSKPGLTALADAPAASALQSFVPVDADNIGDYLAADGPAGREAYCSRASVSDAALQRYLGRVDRGGGFFRWTVTHRRGELEDILRRKKLAPADSSELADIVVTRRGVSGRATEIELIYQAADGSRSTAVVRGQHEIRGALHEQFLYSSAFDVRVERGADGRARGFHFDGAGWGHGAGLCQIGALGMALAGHNHRAILGHYFPMARLASVYA